MLAANEHLLVATCAAATTMRRFQSDAASGSQQTAQSTHQTSPGAQTALDVARKVSKLKKMHQTAPGSERKRLEKIAWSEINTLSEPAIEEAEGQAVALLLNAWAYFAKFWERGKDGPADASN